MPPSHSSQDDAVIDIDDLTQRRSLLSLPHQLVQQFPLTGIPRSIRLLDILPASNKSTPLSATLKVVQLDKNPHFSALSYVWGDEKDTRSISCSGYTLNITKNCHDALIDLRTIHKNGITVWVDAVCINQNDRSEKSVQIPLMGEIFTWAERVYIWLGHSDNSCQRGVASLQRIAKLQPPRFGAPWKATRHERSIVMDKISVFAKVNCYFMWKFFTSLLFLDRRDTLRHDLGGNDYTSIDIDTLLRREWLQRAWTFQEVILASNPILVCGTTVLPWSILQRALGIYSLYVGSIYTRHSALEDWLVIGRIWDNVSRPTRRNPKVTKPVANKKHTDEESATNITFEKMILNDDAPMDMISVKDYTANHLRLYQKWGGLLAFLLRCLSVWILFWIPVILAVTLKKGLDRQLLLAIFTPLLFGSLITLGWRTYTITSWFSPNEFLKDNEGQVVIGLLKALRQRRADDPRDKSFALNGVLQALGSSPSRPNYADAPGLVYWKLFKDLLRWRHDMIILLLDVGPPMESTPSWVPDWTTLPERTWLEYRHAYDISSQPRMFREPQIRDLELDVQGIIIGTVTFCSDTFDYIDLGKLRAPYQSIREKLDSALSQFSQWLRTTSRDAAVSSIYEHFSKAVFDALHGRVSDLNGADTAGFTEWRNVMAGWNSSGTQSTIDGILNNAYAEPRVINFTAKLCNMLHGRRSLLSSRAGHIGSGPPQMLVDDKIVLVSGVPAPLIIREEAETPGKYTVLGPAFICGFMGWDENEQREEEWVSLTFV